MDVDNRLADGRFPRSSQYHPDWVISSASGGANSLWIAEWLTEALPLKPGMRVLDLGCGRASSSIFLHREFGVQVWAADLWFSPTENYLRIVDAGCENGVFPIRVEAQSLPFPERFFDAIVCIDSFMYFASDDAFLGNVGRFLKPSGYIALAGAGLKRELPEIPACLKPWWSTDTWSLHSADYWRWHWERTGLVAIEVADNMPEGWKWWLKWHETICPNNHLEINALKEDKGENLGYVRVVARAHEDAKFTEPVGAIPLNYERQPLRRNE